ncbi:MAG: 4-hydroxy-tetrahydrodipicolinate reductase [Lachnospiraceae bacterium]|nr:4-hydroxy-tetrahydrodipicolinate reductase [Lachnospiraceae bacterium]
MINVVLYGACGKMGHVVYDIISKDERMQVVSGVDIYDDGKYPFRVCKELDELRQTPDVIIDFSSAKAVDKLLDYCARTGTPVVLCSTGLSQEQLDKVKKTSESTAVLKSANMSLGVNLLLKILSQYAPQLAEAGFDIEIVEKHHNQKLDAPSGTAVALADAINDACDGQYEYIYDRSQRREKRGAKELGISAVRGGTIVGDHDVIFAGLDEVITFSHRAYSKSLFAKGAVDAAAFLAGKGPGLYNMQDVINC